MSSQLTTKDLADRLASTIEEVKTVITHTSDFDLARKTDPKKWSKKEILGHLIDSGINNLQRFTEIQFKPQPFVIKSYSQDELVAVNAYQQAPVEEILSCWLAINVRIGNVIRSLPAGKLSAGIILPDGRKADLQFLINDYIDHMMHHNDQLKK
jgi:hypothetical protein